MMTDLTTVSCEACRSDAQKLKQDEYPELLEQLDGWEVVSEDGIDKLRKRFRFPDFVEALAFTNQVGALAESQGHHPDILTEWGCVTVTWWSHKIQGLHTLDFVLAHKTSQL